MYKVSCILKSHTLYLIHNTRYYSGAHSIVFQVFFTTLPYFAPTVVIIVLTTSQEVKTITKPITVLVNIFLPIVLADSVPPNIKIKPEAIIIMPAANGVMVKTKNLIILANPTKISHGSQFKPLQGTKPTAEAETANNRNNKTSVIKK